MLHLPKCIHFNAQKIDLEESFMLNRTRKSVSFLIALCMAMLMFAVVPAALAAAPNLTDNGGVTFIDETSGCLNFIIDTYADLYWAAYVAGTEPALPLTAADIKNDVSAVQRAWDFNKPDGNLVWCVSSLSPGTSYVVYLIATTVDDINEYSDVLVYRFTTLADETSECTCEPWITANQTKTVQVGYTNQWTGWFDLGGADHLAAAWDGDFICINTWEWVNDAHSAIRFRISDGLPAGTYVVRIYAEGSCNFIPYGADFCAVSDPVTFTLHVVDRENPLPQPEPEPEPNLPGIIISDGKPSTPGTPPTVVTPIPDAPQTGDGTGLVLAMAAVLCMTVAALWVKRRVRD